MWQTPYSAPILLLMYVGLLVVVLLLEKRFIYPSTQSTTALAVGECSLLRMSPAWA
jgi:hypothetical protein